MKDRNVIIVVIVAVFFLYLIGNYLGINAEIVRTRFCDDSDDGKNIYMPGHVVSDIGTFRDRCNTGLKSVREYYCGEILNAGEDRVLSNILPCGNGYHCERDVIGQDDACVRD